jgi:hypothetical protein
MDFPSRSLTGAGGVAGSADGTWIFCRQSAGIVISTDRQLDGLRDEQGGDVHCAVSDALQHKLMYSYTLPIALCK